MRPSLVVRRDAIRYVIRLDAFRDRCKAFLVPKGRCFMPEPSAITSVHNPRVKAAAALRERRERLQQRRFLIDGCREIGRALDSGVELLEIFVCRERCRSSAAEELLTRIEQLAAARSGSSPAPQFEVAPRVFEKLAYGERDEGIVAVARLAPRRLDDLRLPPQALVGVLADVEKPGNLGAVARSADAAGVQALLVAGQGADPFNPNAIRASLGTIFALPVVQATEQEILDWLRAGGYRIYAARVDGAVPYDRADFRGAAAIVLGSEAVGLGPLWTAPDIAAVQLPMHGIADSLNVSATAAVLFYEALRQRKPT